MNSRMLEIIEEEENKKLAEKHKQVDALFEKINECSAKISSINKEIDSCIVDRINRLSEHVANNAQNDVVSRFARSLRLNKIVEGDFNYITFYDILTENDLINLDIGNELGTLCEFMREYSSENKAKFTCSSDTCSLIVTTEDNIVTDIELNYF
mgnify:CR=1 FL=1